MSEIPDHPGGISRRDFIRAVAIGSTAVLQASCCKVNNAIDEKPVVSIVKIRLGIDRKKEIFEAVELAIDHLGGIKRIMGSKTSIMLKPNLVNDSKSCTTKPDVVNALATLMKAKNLDISIAEGSAGAAGHSTAANCYLMDPEKLDAMQQAVFERLGYADFADSLGVPLINLHTGDMVEIDVPDGNAYSTLTINRLLSEVDMLCSVPMMKTHERATVTLGMKNLIGLYPGKVYGSIRSSVHDHAMAAGSQGVAFEIIDMMKAIGNKFGLVVIDGSKAMQGNGPTNGDLVDMNVIIAGTNPLATDMVAANVMGFEPDEVPHFALAHVSGMLPQSLDEIEIRGEEIASVRRNLVKPIMNPWGADSDSYNLCL